MLFWRRSIIRGQTAICTLSGLGDREGERRGMIGLQGTRASGEGNEGLNRQLREDKSLYPG